MRTNGRQLDNKHCAARHAGTKADRSAMLLHDAPGNGQPEPRAALLGGCERFK